MKYKIYYRWDYEHANVKNYIKRLSAPDLKNEHYKINWDKKTTKKYADKISLFNARIVIILSKIDMIYSH